MGELNFSIWAPMIKIQNHQDREGKELNCHQYFIPSLRIIIFTPALQMERVKLFLSIRLQNLHFMMITCQTANRSSIRIREKCLVFKSSKLCKTMNLKACEARLSTWTKLTLLRFPRNITHNPRIIHHAKAIQRNNRWSFIAGLRCRIMLKPTMLGWERGL
jgi:hypothetical protein